MAFGDVVQSNTGTSALTTTTPTLGSATTANNIVVLTFAADDYNGTPNTGWTQSSEMEQQTFHGGYLWWFRCAGSDAIPSYTIGSAARSAWTLVEYAGPFDATPYDVSEGQFVQSSANSYTTANMTPTTGSRLALAGLNAQHAAADLAAWQNFTNSFVSAASVLTNGANPRLSVAQVRRVITGDGATTFATGGDHGAQVSQSRSAVIIAFKQAAGGGGGGNVLSSRGNTGKGVVDGTLAAAIDGG